MSKKIVFNENDVCKIKQLYLDGISCEKIGDKRNNNIIKKEIQ